MGNQPIRIDRRLIPPLSSGRAVISTSLARSASVTLASAGAVVRKDVPELVRPVIVSPWIVTSLTWPCSTWSMKRE